MGNLTAFGLACDLLGAVILLGPEYGPIERAVKRLDPLYQAINIGMLAFYQKAITVEEGVGRSEGTMSAGHWKFFAARYFLNKRIEGRINPDDTMSLGGVGIRRNGEEISLPEEHHGTAITGILSTTVVDDWLEDLQERRMYRIGAGLLVSGFAIQLIAEFI